MAVISSTSMLFLLCLMATLLSVYAQQSTCPNGCSSRGVCTNGVCTCAEGLTGQDCSGQATNIPSPYECPSCYQITVGPAIYYYGPDWRLPDGPIVSLNFRGNLSVYQGNGYAQLLANGTDPENWEPTPLASLYPGTGFDACGAWLMRAFTDGNKVRAFYHAERACNYANNGQTRKSGGYAESQNAGITLTSPNYPNNKIIDSSTPELVGRPSGEGDFGVAMKDGYYYLYFADVENYTIGVARASVASGGVPGSWYKYFNGGYTEPGLGGRHTPLGGMAGTQVYVHTPSDSFLSVGDSNWNVGSAISSSEDGINWNTVNDPLVTGDPTLVQDTILYQSLMGATGGGDVGTNFDMYYMWVAPGESWLQRYQIRRNVSLAYVGKSNDNSTHPKNKLALTSYTSRVTGKRAESIELVRYPFMPTSIVGYLMTVPYSHTFPLYECYNYALDDYFVGTSDECYAAGVQALRVAGHLWKSRVERSVAVYRCNAVNDTFISVDPKCEGKGSIPAKPYGYAMQGPDMSPALAARETFISQGSVWRYTNGTSEPANQAAFLWTMNGYKDDSWYTAQAPFGTGYSPSLIKSPFGATNYYFRSHFTFNTTQVLERLVVSVAADDYALIYVNGALVDSDITTHHEAAYWNRQVSVPLGILIPRAINTVAVVVKNADQWAFFDMAVTARYFQTPVTPTVVSQTCAQDCGINGQCVGGQCACDAQYTGPGCTTSLCKYTAPYNVTAIPKASTWRHIQSTNIQSTPVNFNGVGYDDSWWSNNLAPFASNYYSSYNTSISVARRLYRKTFALNATTGQAVLSATISIASCASHHIWVNGVFIGDSQAGSGHDAKYWNSVYAVDPSLFTLANNTIAVEIQSVPWDRTFFDLQLQMTLASSTCSPAPTNAPPTNSASKSTTKSATTRASTTDDGVDNIKHNDGSRLTMAYVTVMCGLLLALFQ